MQLTFVLQRSRIKSACAVYAWDASTLYPWKLVAHVIKRCLGMGLNLQTWTPALSVSASPTSPGSWAVTTERGTITTPTVVHCTNAYAGAILPEFAPVIQPRPHMCNRAVPPRAWSGSGALQNSYGKYLAVDEVAGGQMALRGDSDTIGFAERFWLKIQYKYKKEAHEEIKKKEAMELAKSLKEKNILKVDVEVCAIHKANYLLYSSRYAGT